VTNVNQWAGLNGNISKYELVAHPGGSVTDETLTSFQQVSMANAELLQCSAVFRRGSQWGLIAAL